MKCVFCDSSKLNLEKFYEDDAFVAIYDLRPVTEGHSLIIPKRHVESLLSLNEKEKEHLASFMKKTAFIALKFADAYQFDMTLQEGKDAGQSINHVHFHIIPRKKNDVLSPEQRWLGKPEHYFENINRNLSKEDMERAVKKLRLIAKQHVVQLESL